jgi:hypothetical protein
LTINANPDPQDAGATGGNAVSSGALDGNITLAGSSFATPEMIYGNNITIASSNGSSGTITVRGEITAAGRSETVDNLPVRGQIFITADNGDINILPGTNMQLYRGEKGILLWAKNANAKINIGQDSMLLASGNDGFSRFTAITGPLSGATGFAPDGLPDFGGVAPVAGSASVSSIIKKTKADPTVFYNAGITTPTTAGAIPVTVYALGNETRVLFRGTSKSSITLGSGVQVGASKSRRLTSLDLTNNTLPQANTSVVSTLIKMQKNDLTLGGILTFTELQSVKTITGGNVIIYPINLQRSVSAFNLPNKVGMTFQNFTFNNPVEVAVDVTSTQTNVAVNGSLDFKGPALTSTAIFKVTGATQPTLSIATTGKISSTANLVLSTTGAINVGAPVTAAGALSMSAKSFNLLNTSLTATPAGATISGKGLSLVTSGPINLAAGSLKSTAKLSATGTLIIANNNTASTPAAKISVLGLSPFNVSVTDFAKMTAPTVQIGDMTNPLGSITIGTSLNTVSLATATASGAQFVGVKNLSFVSAGDVVGAGKTFTMGAKRLSMLSNTGLITTGNGITSTGAITVDTSGSIIVGGNITTSGAGVLSLVTHGGGDIDLSNFIVGGGAITTVNAGDELVHTGARVNGLTVTLGAGGDGIALLDTNAKTLSLLTGGTANIRLVTPGVLTLKQSSVHNLNLTSTGGPTFLSSTLNIAGQIDASGAIDVEMLGANSKISIQNNIFADELTLTATGTGTISQLKNTFLITANTLNVETAAGIIGTIAMPIATNVGTINVETTGPLAAAYFASKARVSVNVDPGSAPKEFSVISSAEDVGVSPAITLVTSINSAKVTLRATNVTKGSVSILGTISNPLTTGSAVLQANGAGQITTSGAGTVGSANLLISGAGSAVFKSSFTGALKVTATGLGLLDLDTQTNLLSILGTVAAVDINNTGGLTTNAMSTTNGGIKLTSNSAININGNLKAIGGNILIQTSDSDSSIVFKGGVQVTTLVPAPTKTSLNDGSAGRIEVISGSGNASVTNQGQAFFPVGVNVLQTAPGGAYAGTNPSKIQKGPGGIATVNALRANVILDAKGNGTITLNPGVLLRADPPAAAVSIAPPVVTANLEASSAQAAGIAPVLTTTQPMNAAAALSGVPAIQSAPIAFSVSTISSTTANNAAVHANTSSAVNTNVNTLPAVNRSFAAPVVHQIEGVNRATVDRDDIVLYDGTELRSAENVAEKTQPTAELTPVAFHAPRATAPHTMATNNVTLQNGSLTLNKGTVILAPKKASIVTTPLGFINVSAKSVIMVVATKDSVAVYDFHDDRTGGVSIVAAGTTLPLAPGHHVMLTSRTSANYDRLNPIGCITHRSLTAHEANGIKVHSSQFSIMSALSGMKVFGTLRAKGDTRILEPALKNAAIIMQTRKTNETYRQYRTSDELAKM